MPEISSGNCHRPRGCVHDVHACNRASRRGRGREFTCRACEAPAGTLTCLTSRSSSGRWKTGSDEGRRMRYTSDGAPWRWKTRGADTSLGKKWGEGGDEGDSYEDDGDDDGDNDDDDDDDARRTPPSSQTASVGCICRELADKSRRVPATRGRGRGGTIIISSAVSRHHERTRLGQPRQSRSRRSIRDRLRNRERARSRDAGRRFRMPHFDVDIESVSHSRVAAYTFGTWNETGVRLDIGKRKRKNAKGIRSLAVRTKPCWVCSFHLCPSAMFSVFSRETRLTYAGFFYVLKK